MLKTDSLNTKFFDQGQQAFTNYCISCHHIRKKEGFLWPSVLELSDLDSTSRNELLKNIFRDSIHQNIIVHISSNDFKSIKYFIDNKKKIFSSYQ